MQFDKAFVDDIRQIWQIARSKAYTIVNRAMIEAYWLIGQRIVIEEQKGATKAQYGDFLLRELAKRLSEELDKHFDERELRRIRQFYLCFENRDALRPEITWTHYRIILRVENPTARRYYMNESASQGWGTRILERNIQSGYYERLISTKHFKDPLPISPISTQTSPDQVIKDPYVLEFLGTAIPPGFSESDLEKAILANLQHFLLEMGKGFAFVGRQIPVKTETKQFFIDLVFYNYILKCFVLIDLKVNELTHQDIGQMDMYCRIFEDLKKIPGDNPTIGIILCSEKDATLVKYSVLDENKHLFASSYKLILPSEQELIQEIEREKQSFNDRVQFSDQDSSDPRTKL